MCPLVNSTELNMQLVVFKPFCLKRNLSTLEGKARQNGVMGGSLASVLSTQG